VPLFRSHRMFERIFHDHNKSLWRFAWFLGSSRCEAEEVLQQTWLRAWENLPSLKKEGKARAWLFTILYREFLKIRRRPFTGESLDAIQKLPDLRQNSPGLQIDLERAIRELPEVFRAPLVMQIASGLSINEIAEILDIPHGTALSRIARARKCLITAHPQATWTVYKNEQKIS